MSKYENNGWHTTDLVLSIMERVALHLDLDINDDVVANKLYWICCDLESWDEDQGFGSSDVYGYIEQAKKEFDKE
jgi:hypothetical protein